MRRLLVLGVLYWASLGCNAMAQPVTPHAFRFEIKLVVDGQTITRGDTILCEPDSKEPRLFGKRPRPAAIVQKLRDGQAIVIPVSMWLCMQWHHTWAPANRDWSDDGAALVEAVPDANFLPRIFLADSFDDPRKLIAFESERSLMAADARVRVLSVRLEPLPYPPVADDLSDLRAQADAMPVFRAGLPSDPNRIVAWFADTLTPFPEPQWRKHAAISAHLASLPADALVALSADMADVFVDFANGIGRRYPRVYMATWYRGIPRGARGDPDMGLLRLPEMPVPSRVEAVQSSTEIDRADDMIAMQYAGGQIVARSRDRGYRVYQRQEDRKLLPIHPALSLVLDGLPALASPRSINLYFDGRTKTLFLSGP